MAHLATEAIEDLWYPPQAYPDLGLRRIRLLRIGRGYQSDAPRLQNNITCMMTEMSLDDPRDYLVFDAVSYAWGDQSNPELITVNGHQLAVTRNLYEALVLFREDYNVERWLWVDAICINQRNTDELSRQVAMMGEIFRRASTVRVWLGPAAEHTDLCLDELAEFVPEPSFESLSTLRAPDYLLESDAFYHGLLDLSRRRWWRRLWTVQEVTLASQPTLHCGNITVNFRLLVARLYVFWCSLLQTVASPPRASSRMRPRGLSTQRLTAFYEICGDFLPFISVFRRASDLSTDEIDPRVVIEHLALISSMQATLPRDRIYGLLGLLPRSLVFAIGVDYGSPDEHVYEEAAAQIMSWSSSLELLGLSEVVRKESIPRFGGFQLTQWPVWLSDLAKLFIKHNDSPTDSNESATRPSWVPKWDTSSTLHNPSFWVTSYEAARNIPCLVRYDGSGTLTIRAYLLDQLFAISQTCPSVSYTEQVAGIPRSEVVEVLQQWRSLYAMMSASISEEEQIVPFWRTLTMDRIFQEDLLSRRRWTKGDFWQGLMFETWLRHPSSLELFANAATRNRIRSNILGALANRTFFLTSQKRAGVIQCSADQLRETDVVALLAGLHMPAILRPEGDGYSFVGPCYIDGIMYGEAIETAEFSELVLV